MTWRGSCANTRRWTDGWLFPSEKVKTPLAKDNLWRRHIAPKLEKIGLGWVNFTSYGHPDFTRNHI